MGLLRALHLRDVAALLDRDLPCPRKPRADVAGELGRHERIVAAPDEQRRRVAASPASGRSRDCRTARRDRCCARWPETRSALLGFGRSAGTRRPSDRLRRGRAHRRRRTCSRTARPPSSVGSGEEAARTRVGAGGRSGAARAGPRRPLDTAARAPLTRSGAVSAISIAIRPPIELPITWARSICQLVHQPEHDLGEPAGVVGAERGLARRAEPGQIGGVDAVAPAQRSGRVEERGARPAETVEQQDVRARCPSSASRSGAVRPRRRWISHQRRAAAGAPEQALEVHGIVEVSPDLEQPALEGLDAREVALAQAHPRFGVGRDRDVGRAARGALAHAGVRARCSGPPRSARDRTDGRGRWCRTRPRPPDSGQAASGMPGRPLSPARACGHSPSTDETLHIAPVVSAHSTLMPPERVLRHARVAGRCATIYLHDTRSGTVRRARAAGAGPGRASTSAGRPSTAASTSATPARSSSSR